MSNLTSPSSRLSLASVFLPPLQAIFHFRLSLAEKKALKQLILCRFAVRNIFACHRAAITIKPPTCRGVARSAKTEAHRINRL